MLARHRARRPIWLGLICCVVLLIASCGGGVQRGDATQDTSLGASNPYGGNPEAEGEPVRGGEMVLGMDREARGFDPTVQGSNMAASAVYDSLLRFTPEGQTEPYLAESMATTDDGTTWVMGLREGVEFHDGTPLNADAVIFNVQRHRDDASSPGNIYAQRIESMRAVDDLTVEFVLHEPMGDFPSVFALPYTYGNLGIIGSPTAIREHGDDYTRNPVGAGPFRFVEWVPDNEIVLERNDNYWQDGLPYLDRLEFRPLPDTETRYASVENGDVDLIFAGYHTELIRGLDNPDLTVYYGPGNGAEWIYFNHSRPPFDDRRMREALVRSINLDAMAATQYRGRMGRANSIFSSESDYYSEEAGQAWPEYDPERARQLIAEYEADGGDTSNITYKTTNAPNRVQFGEFLQAQLAEVGLDINIEFYDLAQYSSTLIQSRDFQIGGWVGGPWDHPYPPVYNLFHSEGNGNYGSYSNPEVDELLDQAITTSDDAERVRLYQQIQEITNEEIVVAWYSRGYLNSIAQNDVKGVVRYVSRDMFYATLWLDR